MSVPFVRVPPGHDSTALNFGRRFFRRRGMPEEDVAWFTTVKDVDTLSIGCSGKEHLQAILSAWATVTTNRRLTGLECRACFWYNLRGHRNGAPSVDWVSVFITSDGYTSAAEKDVLRFLARAGIPYIYERTS